MNNIVLDIETLPTDLPWYSDKLKDKLAPPGSMKKAETIEKWWEEKAPAVLQDRMQRTAMDTSLARIVSIAVKVDDNPTVCFCQRLYHLEHDHDVLESFWNYIDKETNRADIVWITYNGNRFDIPLLVHRSLICRVPPTRFMTSWPRNGERYCDIMESWCGLYGDKISLANLCKLFGIEGPQTKGSDVFEWWLAQDVQKIADHNIEDVESLYELNKTIQEAMYRD